MRYKNSDDNRYRVYEYLWIYRVGGGLYENRSKKT